MALPFIAGIAFGGLAVIAFNNKEKIKANLEIKFKDGIKKGKELAKEAKEYAEYMKKCSLEWHEKRGRDE